MKHVTVDGRKLAYVAQPGAGPGIVFLGGFKSDMSGSKATHLEAFAQAQGRAYLRLDYSGHGASEGAFVDGTIGRWARDAEAVISAVTDGPQVIVGSSMGGWIALLLARDRRVEISGLVTIAAAPDFTEDGFWAGFSEAERATLMRDGVIHVPSEYGDPYPISRTLIEEGRDNLVLRSPLALDVPVRMLQGTRDTSVPVTTAVRLLDHTVAEDMALEIVKGADHSFSSPANLTRIEAAILAVSQA